MTVNAAGLSFVANRQGQLILLALGLLCLLLATGGDPARVSFRQEIGADGSYWRWLSAHVVHLGFAHCLMNVAALGLIVILFGRRYGALAWIGIFILSALMISAGLELWRQDLGWYVGLSGVLHGFFMAGLVARAGQRDLEFWVLGCGLLAKLLWEQLVGPLPGSEAGAGGAVVVEAHSIGALAGLLAGVLISLMSGRRSRV